MSMSTRTHITDIQNYDVADIVFGPATSIEIPGMQSPGKRIPIKTKSDTGEPQPLNIALEPNMFSWGLSAGLDQTKKDAGRGYSLSIRMCSTPGQLTSREAKVIEMLDKIADRCKAHIYANRVDLNLKNLKAEDSKYDSLYRVKKSDPTSVPQRDPALYVQLRETKEGEIYTKFRDANKNGRALPPDRIIPTFTNSRATVDVALQVLGIFVGSKCFTVQLKAIEVKYDIIDNVDTPIFEYKKSMDDDDSDVSGVSVSSELNPADLK